jgi:hypothetical protein
MTTTRRVLNAGAALLLLSGLATTLTACQPRASDAPTQVVDGLRFDYGVAPSAVVKMHPLDHPEATMHQGPLPGGYHIALAVSDAKSGARIDDAHVQLDLSGPGHPGHVTMPLDLMTINGAATYGGDVALPSAAKYQLTFDVSRPSLGSTPVKARFVYDRP